MCHKRSRAHKRHPSRDKYDAHTVISLVVLIPPDLPVSYIYPQRRWKTLNISDILRPLSV